MLWHSEVKALLLRSAMELCCLWAKVGCTALLPGAPSAQNTCFSLPFMKVHEHAECIILEHQLCMLHNTACNSCRGEKLHTVSKSDSAEDASLAAGRVTHVAVKIMNQEHDGSAQLAQHEAAVLESLYNKAYVPQFHGYYTDPESKRWHRRVYILTE